jgi:hypothetical protein
MDPIMRPNYDIISVIKEEGRELYVVVKSVPGSPGVTEEITVPLGTGDPNSLYLRDWLKTNSDKLILIESRLIPKRKTPIELRQDRYKNEADPLLLSVYGYDIEIANETDPIKKAALFVKRNKAASDYITIKNKIRTEVPD